MSYASGGSDALYSYWLASLLFLGLSKTGGLALTALVMGVCVATLYAFVWRCLREFQLGPVSATLIVLLTALMGSNNWSTRPQIFALPLFGASLYLLIRWLKGQSQPLWFLPLIALLWANLHGSFVLLFILLGSALIAGGGKRKVLAWVLLACLVATLLNPYGIRIWVNTFAMIGNDAINKFSSEWQPPVNLGWQMNLFFASFLIMILVSACTKQKVKRFGGCGSWVRLDGAQQSAVRVMVFGLHRPAAGAIERALVDKNAGSQTDPANTGIQPGAIHPLVGRHAGLFAGDPPALVGASPREFDFINPGRGGHLAA
jgi:hypothetical protein